MSAMNDTVRLCEWGKTECHKFDRVQREAIELAAKRWQAENRLSAVPLYFAGAEGRTLCARQYVGVVEAAGCVVEIYPKLDAALLKTDTDDGTESAALSAAAPNVMRSLLWMLDAARIVDAPPADTAALDEELTDFIDVFAYLLAKNLRAELAHGVARRYETEEGNVQAIRGRLQIATQVCRNAARMDYLACKWDEFSPNTPENRLFRCACRHLAPRIHHAETAYLLQECLMLLDEVENVSPASALYAVRHMRRFQQWNRNTARFQRPFELAHRLLSGFGHALHSADADTFVFLLDMNEVFEGFVGAALAARFHADIETQQSIGYLLQGANSGKAGHIRQKPDFYWQESGGSNRAWIGDAKYKLLGRTNPHLAATFAGSDIDSETNSDSDFGASAYARANKAAISPDDICQLTVYAELDARKRDTWRTDSRASLMIFYPVVGSQSTSLPVSRTIAWNQSPLSLVPVRVNQTANLADALPSEAF